MTINKSQGQTLSCVGVYLFADSCFGHGQLYVAFSRSGYPPSAAKGARVVAVEWRAPKVTSKAPTGGVFTRKVVYREVLAA